MAKLIVLRGLPASGKSTLAKEMMAKDGNIVRVNKDLLREMLYWNKFSGKSEGFIWEVERMIAKHFLDSDRNVIVDDTNLNPNTFGSWFQFAKETGHKIEHVDVDTDYKECLKRDESRDKRVGKAAIMDMAFMSGKIEAPKKGFVIYDIDGTLADIEHRRHFVQTDPKDWKSFFNHMMSDKLRENVWEDLVNDVESGYGIILVSGRPDNYRAFTLDWLKENKCHHTHLFMRKASDKRPDTDVKRDIYNKYLKGYNIVKVVDDRPSVIRMWRELGLNVVDVGNQIEF